ncbi:MAG: hypothetical protein ACRC9X_01485 [Bacteroidales bacterium]
MAILVTAPTILELTVVEKYLKHLPQLEFRVTGIGLLPCVYNLTKLLLQNTYTYVFQIGIAGTFTPTLPLGSACVVGKESLAHQLAEDTNGNLQALPPFLNINTPLHCPQAQMLSLSNNTPIVEGLTVSILTECANSIRERTSRYHCQIESMEGAAFHYVCLQQQVRFLQVRGISNLVGNRNKAEWCIDVALQSATLSLEQIITQLPKL